VDPLRSRLSLRSRVFGDTVHNCTPTCAQREQKPGLAVPAEFESIGWTLLCGLQHALHSSPPDSPRMEFLRQRVWLNAEYYAYHSGGYLPLWDTGEPLPVVNPDQLHACWMTAETNLLHAMGFPPQCVAFSVQPRLSSWCL
jgi:hypothetical protein